MSDANLEKDLNATPDVFKQLYNNMKVGFPIWEDFIQRGQRFQRSLEQLIAAFSSFLDGFARLADMATQSKGGTQQIGTSLTDLVRWHKAVELKIREINYSFSSKLLTPVGNRLDEWKRSLSALEKDHDKEMTKAIKESKEAVKGTIKVAKTLECKRKKDKNIGPLLQQHEQLQMETDQKIADTELKEKVHMSRLMVEERVWFSMVSNAFKSVLDNEITLTGDLERLPQLIEELKDSASSPSILPPNIRDYIENWQIPSIHTTTRSRSGSQPTLTTQSTGNPLESEMSISSPLHSLGPSVTSLTSVESSHSTNNVNNNGPLDGITNIQKPPTPPYPPPPAPPTVPPPNHPGIYRQPLPEELYDVPISSAYVSVSPSQVSLVSNSSHHSADSTHSSNRSASPPYTHMAPSQSSRPQFPLPSSIDMRPPCPLPPSNDPYSTYQQPNPFVNHINQSSSPFTVQQELLNKTRRAYETDIVSPTHFRTTNNTMESSRYIPATLPRPPKKPVATPPVKQKPKARSNSSSQYRNHSVPPPDNTSVDVEDDDTNSSSPFAQALRQKQLRRAATVSDRSAPKL